MKYGADYERLWIKLLCFDTESFAFVDAYEDKPTLIIIRTFSDTADEKKHLDNLKQP